MTDAPKLTIPQRLLLYTLMRSPERVDPKWRPGKRLIELGYARWRGDVMHVTKKGREAYLEAVK